MAECSLSWDEQVERKSTGASPGIGCETAIKTSTA